MIAAMTWPDAFAFAALCLAAAICVAAFCWMLTK
jgi:hypothetical protein